MIQLFSVNSSIKSYYENLGIARIKTFLEERGYQTDDTYLFADSNIENQLSLVNSNTRYFGFSFQYVFSKFIFAFAKEIKRMIPNAIIFLGGRSATIAYKDILNQNECIDSVILGYGEFPMYEAIKQLEVGVSMDDISKSNVYIATKKYMENKKECHTDINLLSLPKRNFDSNNLITAAICASHGCVGRCTFCTWKGGDVKWCGRDMKEVFEEIKKINIDFGIRIFCFNDASFEDPGLLGKKRINEFCDYISQYEVALSFRCCLRAETFKNNIDDINLLKKMRANGFSIIFVGLESMAAEDLVLYNKRATINDNLNIIDLLKANDIELVYGFIMMNPYSTLDTLKRNYNFLKNNNCSHLNPYISVISIYYNTKMYDLALKDDLLFENFSYKNPYAYKNKNIETESIKQFIMEICRGDLASEYWEYYSSMNNIYHFKAIYRNVYDEYSNDIFKINQNLANTLSEYFFNLFEINDVSICRDNFDHFKQAISNEYQQLNKLMLKLMKKCKKQEVLN